jgi:hypothetical protein
MNGSGDGGDGGGGGAWEEEGIWELCRKRCLGFRVLKRERERERESSFFFLSLDSWPCHDAVVIAERSVHFSSFQFTSLHLSC